MKRNLVVLEHRQAKGQLLSSRELDVTKPPSNRLEVLLSLEERSKDLLKNFHLWQGGTACHHKSELYFAYSCDNKYKTSKEM